MLVWVGEGYVPRYLAVGDKLQGARSLGPADRVPHPSPDSQAPILPVAPCSSLRGHPSAPPFFKSPSIDAFDLEGKLNQSQSRPPLPL